MAGGESEQSFYKVIKETSLKMGSLSRDDNAVSDVQDLGAYTPGRGRRPPGGTGGVGRVC